MDPAYGTVFGTPVVRHGDRVQIVDRTIPDRNGLYIAQKVETIFGLGGYRQIIELGVKVNSYKRNDACSFYVKSTTLFMNLFNGCLAMGSRFFKEWGLAGRN
jgi:hypothetical protein